jgi:uncharacterized integral membrane protein
MFFQLKKIFFTLLFNSCLFFLLVIGIQNNSNKSKVNLLVDETVNLPVGFIVGTSLISGSILGGLLNLKYRDKK